MAGPEEAAPLAAVPEPPTPAPEAEPVESVASETGQEPVGGGETVSAPVADVPPSAEPAAAAETVTETPEPAAVVQAESAEEAPAGKKEKATKPAKADVGKTPKAAQAAGKKSAKKAEAPPVPQGPKSDKMQWYILKVQSNREESIRDGLLRRIAIAGLDEFVGDVIVPVEKVTEFKGGKRRVMKRKLYPGYLVVQMEINEDTWFVVRETPGIGDFTGASGHPTTMLPHEVSRILAKKAEKTDEQPKLDIKFRSGDRVKINEGTFDNFEGEVDSIDQTNGRVTVMINIFGRSTPVELEYWQIESI